MVRLGVNRSTFRAFSILIIIFLFKLPLSHAELPAFTNLSQEEARAFRVLALRQGSESSRFTPPPDRLVIWNQKRVSYRVHRNSKSGYPNDFKDLLAEVGSASGVTFEERNTISDVEVLYFKSPDQVVSYLPLMRGATSSLDEFNHYIGQLSKPISCHIKFRVERYVIKKAFILIYDGMSDALVRRCEGMMSFMVAGILNFNHYGVDSIMNYRNNNSITAIDAKVLGLMYSDGVRAGLSWGGFLGKLETGGGLGNQTE